MNTGIACRRRVHLVEEARKLGEHCARGQRAARHPRERKRTERLLVTRRQLEQLDELVDLRRRARAHLVHRLILLVADPALRRLGRRRGLDEVMHPERAAVLQPEHA